MELEMEGWEDWKHFDKVNVTKVEGLKDGRWKMEGLKHFDRLNVTKVEGLRD